MEFVINKNEEYDNYYIIDFLNIFSDYREIIYKKKNMFSIENVLHFVLS